VLKFDSEYLESEMVKFQELMGNKSFWSDSESVQGAIFGLLYVWGHTQNVSKELNNLMIAITKEYDMRLKYVLVAD
jgi:hypothetical protein